jgi:hypothetical protein
MSTNQNFASFKDDDSDAYVFVESFDNIEFEVRIGSVSVSTYQATIMASSDEDLNGQLCDMFNK